MKLSEVWIREFRSIKSQTIAFSNRCQILVGINESGKTNILRAIRLIDQNEKCSAADKRVPLENEPANAPASIHFKFPLEASESEALYKKFDARFLRKKRDEPLFQEGTKALSLKAYASKHDTALYWVNVTTTNKHFGGYTHETGLDLLDGWKRRKPEATGTTVASYDGMLKPIEKFDYIFAPDFPELPLDHFQDAKVSEIDALFTAALGEMLKPNLPKCVFWAYKDEFLLPPSIPINEFIENPSTCLPLKYMFALAEVADIKKAVLEARALGANRLRNLFERVASRSRSHVSSIWKEYKQVEIKLELNGENLDVSVIDHQNRYNFSDRSDGFKRFVSFLLVISAQVRTDQLTNTLLLIDEPEIGLHPSGVKYLRDELIRIAEKNLVVVSTHSIFMIDKNKIDRHLIVTKSGEQTQVKQVDTTNIVEEEVIYNALGYSVFETLCPFNFVFEGWRDKRLFETAVLDSTRADKDLAKKLLAQGRCHLQGVKDAGRVVPLIELAGREYVIVSDCDQPAVEAKKKFRGDGKWLTYSDFGAAGVVKTSEDFIAAKAFDKSLSMLSKRYALPALTLADDAGRQGRIETIKAWISSAQGLQAGEIKECLDEVKESVFAEMKKQWILDEYFDVLKKLADCVPHAN